ncbi:ABC-type bacteriocin/lantibiotic exporter, contains an N-terminal double-glycine peptidase domain [Prosthecobacter debontii]|uniref:ABC-type bacteriocin/lantibiotic exporter, contains an N-terminal double-glycine peptidase domain n=1 Tax=Prosthecobacter debontii TaxID=48467 RepID=A0A1T4WFP8_9BACT|nr:ABC transporter ATP-binding protein [Prosthecobacter debontii]SKA76017.1 ABC-type bacteriocin/lantibiotic exporter, contains an N-terminal double-glycine peptidase domain [Prosthecobacter debontii]
MSATPFAISIPLLARLAAITGCEFDPQRADTAVRNAMRVDTEPLALLARAAAEVHMQVSPARMPLAELLWHANHEAPVVLWSEPENRWFIITFTGWFSLRVADQEHLFQHSTLSRAELVRKLGLKTANDTVEGGIVHAERLAQGMSARKLMGQSDHGKGHGIGHDHHHPEISPAKRFLRLLKAERQDIFTLLVFSFFSGILYLAAPLAVDTVVSSLAFGGQSQPYIQALAFVVLALFAALSLQAIVSGFQYYVSDIIQRRIFVRTASDLSYRLPRVKAEALDEVHAPELVNRFLDVVTAQKSTALLLLDGVNLVFGSLIGMVLLALYHPLMLAFVVVLLVLIAVSMWLLGKGAVSTSIAESRVKYDVVNWFEEIAAFPFVFKGPGGYQMAYERANQLATQYLQCRSKHFRVVMRQIIALLALSVFAAAILLILGGWLVISQQMTLGQLVASELIMASIVVAMAKMGKKLEAWYDAMAAMDKLGHIFDLETEREDGEQPAPRKEGVEVTASSLSFGYHEPLFQDLSFTVKPGTHAVIVGPHGSGTSSMLDLLFGLRRPTEGHVSIDGLDLRSWYLEALRESVMLLRRDEIVDGTVIENLRLGSMHVGLDEIRAALEKVGLLSVLLRRPEGLNLRLKIGGAPLSSNQRTRLLLARALVQQPRLLLIDELFDSLDKESFNSLTKAILDPDLPWTVILATRDRDVTAQCQQVIELRPNHPRDDTGRLSTHSAS